MDPVRGSSEKGRLDLGSSGKTSSSGAAGLGSSEMRVTGGGFGGALYWIAAGMVD